MHPRESRGPVRKQARFVLEFCTPAFARAPIYTSAIGRKQPSAIHTPQKNEVRRWAGGLQESKMVLVPPSSGRSALMQDSHDPFATHMGSSSNIPFVALRLPLPPSASQMMKLRSFVGEVYAERPDSGLSERP